VRRTATSCGKRPDITEARGDFLRHRAVEPTWRAATAKIPFKQVCLQTPDFSLSIRPQRTSGFGRTGPATQEQCLSTSLSWSAHEIKSPYLLSDHLVEELGTCRRVPPVAVPHTAAPRFGALEEVDGIAPLPSASPHRSLQFRPRDD
jgi:hypothetical protein